MPYYPVFLNLDNQNVLVIGGGKVAERKIKNLLLYDCKISVISSRLTPHLRKLADQKRIQQLSHDSLEKALDDAFLVIAATDDPEVNNHVASEAKERRLLVNVVDQPEYCNFIMPSMVKRGDLQIAISTAGKSPALAKKIRKEMDSFFGQEYEILVELLGLVRTKLLSQGKPGSKNRFIFQKLVDANLLKLIRERKKNRLTATLASILGQDFPVEDIVKQVFRSNP